MHRFEDAAFLQEQLAHNILSGGYLGRLCNGFQAERYPDLPRGVVHSVTWHTLKRADPIYVSDDVMTLWEHASESFKTEVFRRDDLIIPAGFALLPRPFTMIDIHGKKVAYRVIAWLPISQNETFNWDEGAEGQGVWITLLSHMDDIDDYWLATHTLSDGTSGAVIREAALLMNEPWTLMHGSPIQFDQPPAGILHVDPETGERRILEGEENERGASLYGHIQCFWRLMSQLILTPEPLPRQARRQRQRAGIVDHVKVLRLRRHKHPLPDDHEPQEANYSHRFIVEGHWRNQQYGKKGEETYYRQKWIAPYVKGPDDKPLIIKQRGVEFTR